MSRQRILFRRHAGGLGDVVCSFVALRAARQLYKDAELIAAYGERYHAFAYHQATAMGCDDCISPDAWHEKGDAAFIEQYALDKFDKVINLDGPEVEHAHSTNWKLTKNRLEIWCDTVGLRPGDMRPRLAVDPRDRLRVFRLLQVSGLEPYNFVVVQWAAAESWKDYPNRVELLETLSNRGLNVVVAHNRPLPNDVADDISKIPNVWPLYDQYHPWQFDDLAILCELASAVVCPDSAFLHIAAGVDTPCVALFSGTDGDLTCKYYPLTKVLQNCDVHGQPCANTFPCYGREENNFWCAGRTETPGVPWCLEQITPYQVLMALDELLEAHEPAMQQKRGVVMRSIHEEANVKIDRSSVKGKSRVMVVGVPPGIGDSLWAMTKVKSIMKEDRADGLVICIQKTQPARGREFLKRFSFVDDAVYQDFPIHPLGTSHVQANGLYNYAGGPGGAERDYLGMDWLLIPNTPLERGERLETWLPEFEIDWTIGLNDFKFNDSDRRIANAIASRSEGRGYVVFFLGATDSNTRAGHNRSGSYSVAEWRRFGYSDELYEGMDPRALWPLHYWVNLAKMVVGEAGCKVVLVGARYDAEYAREFLAAWSKAGGSDRDVLNVCGGTQIGETYAVISKARCTVSYQSGIGIFSSYLGIPTLVWWRAKGDSLEQPHNRLVSFEEGMASAWVPPFMLESDSHIAEIYARRTPRAIFADMVSRKFFDADRPRGMELLE